MKINKTLSAQININKYSHDFIEEYEIDQNTTWVKSIITELEEEVDDDYERQAAELTLNIKITRKNDRFLNDHLIIKTLLKGHYHLPCGRCLYPIKQEIDQELNAVFLNDAMSKMPEYTEATTAYADGQEMELYYYSKGQADVSEIVHEHLFSEMPPFPRCDGECKGQIYF